MAQGAPNVESIAYRIARSTAMRILEIKFLAFGPFTDLRLDLSRGDYGLHIIYGPNEAGKSASLRALKSLFYGIPARTTDNFIHEHQALRLGARIQASDGEILEFLRRKGNKDTLLDAEGKPLQDSVLTKFLNGVSEEVFSTMFGIDYESLLRGGEQILKGGGALGESLFAAGMGGANLREVIQSLEDEASKLFLPRGKAQLITSAVNAYKEAKQISSKASLSGKEWIERDRALKEARKQKSEIERELEKRIAEQSRLQRFQKAIPAIAERKELLAGIERIGKVRLLPQSFGKKRRDAIQKLYSAREIEKDGLAKLARLKEKISLLNIPEPLLREADAVTDLQERLGSHKKAFRDLPRLQGEFSQLSNDAAAILRELRPELTLGAVDSLRLTSAKKMRIRELGNRSQAIHDKVAKISQDVKNIEAKLARKKEELQKLPAFRDVSRLRLEAVRAQKQGDIETDRQKAEAALEAAKKQSEVDLERLGLWNGGLDQLEALPVPSPESIDRFESAFENHARNLQGVKDRLTKLLARKSDLDKKIDELRLSGSIPTEEELEEARKRRGNGWLLVRKAWIEGDLAPQAAIDFDPDNPLHIAYEKSVYFCDQVADRLRREADRVARHAALLSQQIQYSEEIEACKREKEELEAELAGCKREWLDLWLPVGIVPLTPREMRSWTAKRLKLSEQAEKLRAEQCRIESLKRRIDEHRTILCEGLIELGEQAPKPESSLEFLVGHALALVEQITEVERRRKEVQKTVVQLEEELVAAAIERDQALKDFSKWKEEWSKAVDEIALSANASPGEANAVLDKIEEIFKRVDKMTGLSSRIAGIKADGEMFEDTARKMAERLAPEASGLSAEGIAVELKNRLRIALEDSATLTELKEQTKEVEQTIRRSTETMRASEMELNVLCREAGCSLYEELEELEERSAAAQALRKEIEAVDKQLTGYSGGLAIEELIHEIEQIDADSLPVQIAGLGQIIKELEETRSRLLEQIGSERTHLDLMDGNAQAAEAAEKAQAILAQICEATNRYTRLRLASILLQREIERYRAENQDPILKRSGELFSKLTLGSFESLQADFNEMDEPALFGVRPGGNRAPIQGMSEGTRDQLYLSLRLASLEKYLQRNEPLPLIIDDILINFDDRRAEATLNILEELSGLTQIIFFTHHAHILELAKDATRESALFIYNLDAASHAPFALPH